MAFYFGCATLGNKIAHGVYGLFTLVSFALLVAWAAKSGKCWAGLAREAYEGSSPCYIFSLHRQPPKYTLNDAAKIHNFQEAVNNTCTDMFTENVTETTKCMECLTSTATCVVNAWPIAVAGLCFAFFTALPCFFCCCCSKWPNKEGQGQEKVEKNILLTTQA